LIEWAAPDRGVISFPEGDDIDSRLRKVLPSLRAWVRS